MKAISMLSTALANRKLAVIRKRITQKIDDKQFGYVVAGQYFEGYFQIDGEIQQLIDHVERFHKYQSVLISSMGTIGQVENFIILRGLYDSYQQWSKRVNSVSKLITDNLDCNLLDDLTQKFTVYDNKPEYDIDLGD